MVSFLPRLLLSSSLVVTGLKNVRDSRRGAQQAQQFMKTYKVNLNEDEAASLVKTDGLAMLGASATMTLGIFPRLSAAALFGIVGVNTVAAHSFWKIPKGEERDAQKKDFYRNLSVMGGLLLVIFGSRKYSKK